MLQVKEALLQRCRELEQTAKEQATDNAILDQLRKVLYLPSVTTVSKSNISYIRIWDFVIFVRAFVEILK